MEQLKLLFVADGVGVNPSVVDELVQPIETLLATHQTPTDILMIKYKSLKAAAATEDIDEAIKREASDRLQHIVTVLQLRADGRHVCESIGEYEGELASVAQDDALARQFVLGLGTQAYGAPPASLGLPPEETLVAQVKCHCDGEIGTMYVTNEFVCFHTDIETAEVQWRAKTIVSAAEHRWHHCGSPAEAAEKLETLHIHVASHLKDASPGIVIKCTALGIDQKPFPSAKAAAAWLRNNVLGEAGHTPVRLRIADIRSAHKETMAEDQSRHVIKTEKMQRAELKIDEQLFEAFESVAARDGVLAHLRRRARELGVALDGQAIRYALSLVTASHEAAALNPYNVAISVVFVGTEGRSPEHLLQPSSDRRALVRPNGCLAVGLEIPKAQELGELTGLVLALVPKLAVTSLFKTSPRWDLAEVRVVNTHTGRLTNFGGAQLGVDAVVIRPSAPAATASDVPVHSHAQQQQQQQEEEVAAAAAEGGGSPPAECPAPADAIRLLSTVIEEVWENQRKKPLARNSTKSSGFTGTNLRSSDPPPFCDGLGRPRYKESVVLPAADVSTGGRTWRWVTEWEVDGAGAMDGDGWEYSRAFSSSSLGGAWEAEPSRTTLVRRRKWFRIRKADSAAASGS